MSWVIPVALIVLWVHGLLLSYTWGTAIQVLLALALVVIVGRIFLGRRAH